MGQIENDVERDYYMTSQEALEYGLIDKILWKSGILTDFFICLIKKS
jgi:ATP-dependent protease ClpP protease subunit